MSTQEIEKLEDMTTGQHWALVNKCGGLETVLAILRGEKEVTVTDLIRMLVDRHGRCIPIKPEVSAAVCDANRKYHLDSLADGFTLDSAWIERWQKLFNQPAGLDETQFNERIADIRARVSDEQTIANLLAGSHFPVLLPRIELGEGGYGAMIESLTLSAVEKAYTEAFPERKFVNHRKGELADQVTIVDERHQRLVDDLAQGSIPGILCFPLQGFSVHAQRQMAMLLPDYMSLAGPIEIGCGEALYPQQLSRDVNTPVKDCSAVQWRAPDSSLCFRAYDDKLEFGFRCRLGHASAGCSGALFLRG